MKNSYNNYGINEDENLLQIQKELYELENPLKTILLKSLAEVNKNPSSEKKLILMWSNFIEKLCNYFITESENSGNKTIVKHIIKFAMFKRI